MTNILWKLQMLMIVFQTNVWTTVSVKMALTHLNVNVPMGLLGLFVTSVSIIRLVRIIQYTFHWNYRNLQYLNLLDVNDCNGNPCNNGGTCKDGIGTYECFCPMGFNGTDCEHSMLIISTSLKPTIKWVEAINESWNIFSDIDDCQSSPCLNNGVCEDGVNSYTCKCAHGFKGDNCSISNVSILNKLHK